MIDDKPLSHQATCISDFMVIVTHPAFRLGFLDAQRGREFDHDKILKRIMDETPASALKRIGYADAFAFTGPDMFGAPDRRETEIAQYRYEEGRLAVLEKGLRCRAWGHPDFPPKAVMDYIYDRSHALQQ